ncbi:GPI mannosyltransferase 3 [Planococcus citri]|uniref:GPI mannosyltransferase 3 n=1 Tax=Planococcus citri TaxID=170843 RepID=UPI0031F7F17C
MHYKNWLLLLICLILRLCCLISRDSYYVPDEYWQSLEVAHRLIFGYGYLTWEWIEGVRSYVYVGWIALLYQFLKFYGLDSAQNLIWLPVIIQAVFSAIADTYFISWAYKISHKRQAYWSVWCYMTNVFLAYCSTRTLTNTIETNLTCIALYYYPWLRREVGNVKYLWFIGLACIIRPTAALMWAPLCFYAIRESSSPIKLVIFKYIPIGLIILSFSTLVDSYFYGKWVLTWWNFFQLNIVHNISAFYSVQSVGWYLMLGLPVVLGHVVVPFYFAMGFLIQDRSPNDGFFHKMVYSVTCALIAYSTIPHKEFRFVLPLCPLMIQIASYGIHRFTCDMKKIYGYLISLTILLVNLQVFYYLSQYHQVATVKVMDYLRSPSNNLLFLMPCHQTPLYSHLHMNITTRFLHCDPDFTNNPRYTEESVQFYRNPLLWLQKEYPDEHSTENPTHIVCFDVLVPVIKKFLDSRRYQEMVKLYHGTLVPPKIGNYLMVFQRTETDVIT